jgi:hypothetical protein
MVGIFKPDSARRGARTQCYNPGQSQFPQAAEGCQTMPSNSDVTMLLQAWRGGDSHALKRLVPLVRTEIHWLAGRYMKRERPGHVLQTTALRLGARTRTDHRHSRVEQSEGLAVPGTVEISGEWRAEFGDDFGVREPAPALMKPACWHGLRDCRVYSKIWPSASTRCCRIWSHYYVSVGSLRRQRAAAEGRVEHRKREQAPALLQKTTTRLTS